MRDLLTFTLGFGILFDETPAHPARHRRAEAGQRPAGPDDPAHPGRVDGPLRHAAADAPAGRALDVQHRQPPAGRAGPRASGQDFDAFVRERILVPLGMRDTGFSRPAREARPLRRLRRRSPIPQKGPVRMDADGAQSAYASPPVFPSGAAGLVSTVDDYLAFARMLLAGGVHQGRRLLSADSVREMTRDQLTAEQKAASASTRFFPGFFDTHGWGYGVAVVTDARRRLAHPRPLRLGRRLRHLLDQRPQPRPGGHRDDPVRGLPVRRRPGRVLAHALRRPTRRLTVGGTPLSLTSPRGRPADGGRANESWGCGGGCFWPTLKGEKPGVTSWRVGWLGGRGG